MKPIILSRSNSTTIWRINCQALLLILVLVALSSDFAMAQSAEASSQSKLDSASIAARRQQMLLTNTGMAIDVTDAVDFMYNFRFEEAEAKFRWFKLQHPSHPLPYFMLGLNEWWKIVPNDNDTQYDDKFLKLMDTTIACAQLLYKKDKRNPEALFFLAAGNGFAGRLHGDRKNWRKAAFFGKVAMQYVQESGGTEDFGAEFLFGKALYNYYRVWIPENYVALRPVMYLFPKGDKTRGIAQLKECALNGFYTRIEAMNYLARIYSVEENRAPEAFPYIKYLYETFPANPYFARQYARVAYVSGHWQEAEAASKLLLSRVDSVKPFYEAVSGRYATFILGFISYYNYRDYPKAKMYLNRCRDFAENTNAKETGYYLFSLVYLARMADKDKEVEEAKKLYTLVVDNAESKSDNYKEASAYIKAHSPKKRFFGLF